jgi:serine/threonine protein kinase
MPPSRDQWRALSAQLDIALEMTEQERCVWLSSMRVRYRTLVSQLESLLGNHRAMARKGFLDGTSAAWLANSGLAGRSMGAYKLISQLGKGGMSSVWLARRNEARCEPEVAVKLLDLALTGPKGEECFNRERMILSRLNHPNIAALIDAGVSSAGQPYLVLEYVDGDHIDRHCDQQRLSVKARVEVFLDVVQTVALVHANRIVHRDLKPPNILVRKKDGQTKLLDFGIARVLENEPREPTALEREGGRAMTPQYAAPEQLTGGAATFASDVYALGVLLFVLLTGYHPAGHGPHTQADLFKNVLEAEPLRPSQVVVQDARSSADLDVTAGHRGTTPEALSRLLGGDLDQIVAKALKKDPADRYGSARELAEDVRGYLRNEPKQATTHHAGPLAVTSQPLTQNVFSARCRLFPLNSDIPGRSTLYVKQRRLTLNQ